MVRMFVAISLIAAACAASPPTETTTAATQAPASPAAVPDDLNPGALDVRSATMSDGTVITYGLILPEGFDADADYPVLLALPPGDQSVDLTMSLAASTYAPEALDKGWVVITPAAPDGVLYFQGSERYLPELIGALAWISPEGGRYHLAGVSNGGRSAFRVAGQHPNMFASVVVYPGFPQSEEDRDALEDLAGIPFAMFVGELDPTWREPMERARDDLTSFGADVHFEVRAGEGHIMRSLADGVDIFAFLESVRSSKSDR